MIKTKFDFTLEIDNESFSLEFKELGTKRGKELAKAFEKVKVKLDRASVLKDDIELLSEHKSILLSAKDNQEVSAELIEIINKIRAKKDELRALENDTSNIDELESLSKKRFEITISGAGLKDLQNCIKTKDISYIELMNAIDEAVAIERSKK